VLPVFQILTLLKLLILALAGKSRNILSNGSFWLIPYLFSIHQINMYMPSTAAPNPCPTLVQRQDPKSGQFLGKNGKKKKALTFWAVHTCFRVQPKQTDSQITSCFVSRVPVPPTGFNVSPFLLTV